MRIARIARGHARRARKSLRCALRRSSIKLAMRYHIIGSLSRHASSLSLSSSHTSLCARRVASGTLPRAFHATPALYALIRSNMTRKKDDLVTIAQQDAKKGKLTAEKYMYNFIFKIILLNLFFTE